MEAHAERKTLNPYAFGFKGSECLHRQTEPSIPAGFESTKMRSEGKGISMFSQTGCDVKIYFVVYLSSSTDFLNHLW